MEFGWFWFAVKHPDDCRGMFVIQGKLLLYVFIFQNVK